MQNEASNLVKISELLSDGQYHDGTSIGKKCGITRAAVWKVIKKLEEYGVEIQSVKGKGYLLEAPFILLDCKLQTQCLFISTARKQGWNVFESTQQVMCGCVPMMA